MGVNDTFHKDLAVGKNFEGMVLDELNKNFPHAYIKEGYFKDYDIYIPELRKSVEAKRDRKSQDTGNLVIETSFGGKPSALSTTKADYWVFDCGDEYILTTPTLINNAILDSKSRQVSFIGKGDTKSKEAYLLKKEYIRKHSLSLGTNLYEVLGHIHYKGVLNGYGLKSPAYDFNDNNFHLDI
jgi:hypothetical protein